MTLLRFSLATALAFTFLAGQAQSGKAFFKEGEDLREQNQLDQAVEKYTLAVKVDPKYLKAFQARADVYELLGKKAECAADRRAVAELDPSEAQYGAKAAKAYLEFLYAPAAQKIIAKNYYRPARPEFADKADLDRLPKLDLIAIDKDFGGWAAAQKKHFADGGVFDDIQK